MIPKLTANGTRLMLRAMGGEGIVFTKIAIGDGDAPEDYTALNDIQNKLVDMEIKKFINEGKYVVIEASMTNSNFNAGFYWTELGVYAKDPDGGEDLLYAYAHYKITGDETATYIPASSSTLVEITHSVHVFVGELDNVTALLTKHGEFASAEDLKNHTEDKNNPHNIDKNAIGLGLIENATPENQKPVFTYSNTYFADENGKITFHTIFSGEKVGSILQKVRSLISLVVNHVNGANPHKIKAGDIGAALSSHTHDERYYTEDEINQKLNNKASASHTHNYAGSSSSGGAAKSANKLNTNAGSGSQPVYFENGIPVAIPYTIAKSVPADAVFTDTTDLTDMTGILPIKAGGTGSASGAVGLENLLKAGPMILSSYQYGDTLPAPGQKGRIFFKKVGG